MKTTFVTAFMELNEPFQRKTYKEDVIKQFRRIANTGIFIHVFLSSTLEPFFHQHIQPRPGLFLTILNFDDLDMYKSIQDLNLTLPSVRSPHKDTKNYMILMNAKSEFLKRSIAIDPFHTNQYAWIDFGVGHIFKNWDLSLKQLQRLAFATYVDECLAFPGCWTCGTDIENVFYRIHWRFCGGFFIGTKERIIEFIHLYDIEFQKLIQSKKSITWEVNVWHWFEYNLGWKPTWYAADHNDSILQIPEVCFKKQEQE